MFLRLGEDEAERRELFPSRVIRKEVLWGMVVGIVWATLLCRLWP